MGTTRPTNTVKINTVGQDVLGRFLKGSEILCQEPWCSSRLCPVSGPPTKGIPGFQSRQDFGDVGKTESFAEDRQRKNDKRDHLCQ